MIYTANPLTGFYMTATLAFNYLKSFLVAIINVWDGDSNYSNIYTKKKKKKQTEKTDQQNKLHYINNINVSADR